MSVIVISGKPGCGSSTIVRLLSKKLNLRHFSVGDYNKGHSKAKNEADRSIDVWKGIGSKKQFHVDSDKLAREMADEGNIVIDGKICIRMLKGHYDYGIWLTAPKSARIKRYAKRDRVDFIAASKKLEEKERLERKSWKRIYGFDYFIQEKEATIRMDTGNKTPEEIVDLLISKIRRVFIVHRWNAKPRSDWYSYVEQELEGKGYLVNVLKMPGTNKPKQAKWVPYLAKSIGQPGKNTFLIGHSAGAITILRYLEQLKRGAKIGGCILVAGWVGDLGYKRLSNFFTKPVNWAKIRQHCRKFVIIQSDNDPYVKMYHATELRRHLGAKLIVEHKKGHLTDDEGIRKLDSVIDSVLRF